MVVIQWHLIKVSKNRPVNEMTAEPDEFGNSGLADFIECHFYMGLGKCCLQEMKIV